MKEYNLKFIKLSRYAPEMVANMRVRMRKFVYGLGKHVQKESKAALLIPGMNISRIMVYAQQIEEDKRKDRDKQINRKGKSARHEPS